MLEIRVAVIGGLRSGKSALVHRYLTGSYVNDESPEGGRFKKEVNVEGLSKIGQVEQFENFDRGKFSTHPYF